MNWIWRLFLLILLLFGWGVVGYYYVDYTLESPKRDKAIELEIPENTSIRQIGKILEEKGLIRDDMFFPYYAEYKKFTNLRAGVYLIEPTENLDAILTKFTEGKQNLVKITVPEGASVIDIAEELGKKGFDKEGFLKEVNRKPGKFSFEKQIPDNKYRKYRLEGYLYPSTYFFRKDATPQEIVDEMLGQFEKKMKELHAEEKLKEKKMTIDQWVMIASLIVREAKDPKELSKIAGVIYNRMNAHMKLDIDATTQYMILLKEGKRRKPTAKDVQVVDPYNTRAVWGPPPGPIGNPGEAALLGALEPAKHDYYYYVAKNDGSGEHYFSKTYQEHQRWIRESDLNEQKSKSQSP